MHATEAYKLFAAELKNLTAISCHEYSDLFVFEAIPKASVGSKDVHQMFDTLYSVDKKTGTVGRFKPFLISAEEYENGKQIYGYKPIADESPETIDLGKTFATKMLSKSVNIKRI